MRLRNFDINFARKYFNDPLLRSGDFARTENILLLLTNIDAFVLAGHQLGYEAIDGEYKSWYNNGQLECHYFYKDGKLHGEYKSWYNNGQPGSHYFYKDGKLRGEYKSWYDNGQPGSHYFYKNGRLHGEYKNWHDNGQLERHCFYKGGKQVQ